MPRETSFFDYFEQHCTLIIQAARELMAMAQPGADICKIAKRISQLEEQTDQIVHRCVRALQQTFITPFDRSHIHDLIKGLDDIIDSIDDASSRICLYEINEVRPEVQKFADLLVQASVAIGDALKQLRETKDPAVIHRMFVAVHGYENEADDIMRSSIKQLFHEGHHIFQVIQWKEIIELLEMAMDRCEDVADIIQGIMIEAS